MPDGFKIYRRLQVLEVLMNDYGRSRLLPSTLGVAPMVEVLGLFTIIKFHEDIPFPGILIFPIGFLTALTGLIVLETMSGALVTRSKEAVLTWAKTLAGSSPLRRRQFDSLQLLKVKFGNNFLDRVTALITQDFCINQTVSLLIMFK